jgi:hypothetical protein
MKIIKYNYLFKSQMSFLTLALKIRKYNKHINDVISYQTIFRIIILKFLIQWKSINYFNIGIAFEQYFSFQHIQIKSFKLINLSI